MKFSEITKFFGASSNNKSRSAFTLIELSIVILIASILITGLMNISVNSINNANVRITNERMKEVYKAIGNFVKANRRLPCPAPLNKAKSIDSDYGTEGSCAVVTGVYQSTTDTKLYYGMVPVKALGLASDMAEDGFGSKIAYIVNKDFTGTFNSTPSDTDTHFGSAANTGSPNYLIIQEKNGGATQVVTSSAIMALISYGANKSGAFNANSSSVNPNTRSSDVDELSNDISPDFDATLVSLQNNSDTFDDIVLAKQRNELVQDFDLMNLIMCKNATGTGFAGSQDAYYGQMVFGSACPVPANGSYSQKCGAYGVWIPVNGC